MSPKNYAIALSRAVTEGCNVNSAIENLIKILKVKGAVKLLPKILYQLEIIKMRENLNKPLVSVAREEDLKVALRESGLKPTEDFNKKIDKTLIGGYKLQKNNKLLDKTYKTALLELYKKVAGVRHKNLK